MRSVWLNQPFLRDVFVQRAARRFCTVWSRRGAGAGLQLTNPQYEILDEEDAETIHTGRIVPVYERTGQVTPKMQRRLVYRRAAEACLPSSPDHLPEGVRLQLELSSPARRAAGCAFSARRRLD